MKNHTPGPWSVKTGEGAHHRDLYIRGPKNVGAPHNVAVARICSYSNSRTECVANASLIAAAPDLLEVVKASLDPIANILCEPPTLESLRALDEIFKAMKLAVAKAEEIAK